MTGASEQDKSTGEAYFLNAGLLHGIAVEAYRRARDRDAAKDIIHRNALVAVVFAAISIEAFVNQIIVNVQFGRSVGRGDVVVLARILELLARDAPVARKYEIIHLILTGDACAKGERPYQDLDVLITLRNWIVHMKPEPLNAMDVTKHLENLQVLKPKRESVIESQLSRIGTVAVARWACNTAADVTQAIAALFRPANNNQKQVFAMFFRGFDRVEDAD